MTDILRTCVMAGPSKFDHGIETFISERNLSQKQGPPLSAGGGPFLLISYVFGLLNNECFGFTIIISIYNQVINSCLNG